MLGPGRRDFYCKLLYVALLTCTQRGALPSLPPAPPRVIETLYCISIQTDAIVSLVEIRT